MKDSEITYIRDMDSPNIGAKQWSNITFVNFEKRRYINESPINAQELDILFENGYKVIDTAIADTIMRLNCILGCKTRHCCSGHPGRFNEGYIVFEDFPETLRREVGKLKYWQVEPSPNANLPHLILLGMNGVPSTDSTTWLKALLELAEMKRLPQSNPFDEYRIDSSYKGRAPHKQEIRHIYPARIPTRTSPNSGLILLAARPGVGIESFARSIAADSIIDATGLDITGVTNIIHQLKRNGKDILVIDNLQTIKCGEFLHTLKMQAITLQIKIIVLVQLGRMLPGKNYERPQISDLRGLDDALPEIDTIWLLDRKFTRTHREEDKHSAELIVINPQNGREKVIPMMFDPECKIFSGENFREELL